MGEDGEEGINSFFKLRQCENSAARRKKNKNKTAVLF